MIITISDTRGGHDGMSTGGHYGWWTTILIRPKSRIEDAAVILSDEDDGYYETGNVMNSHSTDRKVQVELRPDRIEWAVIEKSYDANPYLRGRSDHTGWEPIEGVPGGYFMKLQKFLEEYPRWVDENEIPAGDWLLDVALDEECRQMVEYALRKSAKGTIWRAWEAVAQAFGVQVRCSGSWTSVRSMPIRIARAVRRQYGFGGLRLTPQPKHPGPKPGYWVFDYDTGGFEFVPGEAIEGKAA